MRASVVLWAVGALSAATAQSTAMLEPTISWPEPNENATLKAKSPGTSKAGDDIMMKFEYDDGMGGTAGKFFFNLFEGETCGPGGANNSQSRIAALCKDHNAGGCESDNGEYNVTLPANLATGVYTVNIGYFGPHPRDCSPPFNVSAFGPPVVLSNSTASDMCDATIPINVRYAGGTERIYLEHSLDSKGTPGSGGCATLSLIYQTRMDVKTGVPKGPIYILDEKDEIDMTPFAPYTGKWYVEADIFVLDDITLEIVDEELRIESTETRFHNLRGHGGSLYFSGAVVTSWDLSVGGPREAYDVGRSYISCISEMTGYGDCGGGLGVAKNDMGECRLDVLETEIGYLGWMDSESYGLTWKVRGFCVDKSNPEVFDEVNVYGDIIDSDIHHMYYGMYSYGHQGGTWVRNKMHDNAQYGFDPHDDSDFLTISENDVYNNGNHGIIASKRCNDVEITNNYVHDGTGLIAAGIFLHRSSDRAVVSGNTVENMPDAGIAIMESFDLDIFDNTFTNIKYGVRISVGGANNHIHDNTFETISQYGLYTYQGSDSPDTDSDGRPKDNMFIDNEVLDCIVCMKIGEGDNNMFEGNTFEGRNIKFQFRNARETRFLTNTFPSNAEFSTTTSCFTDDSISEVSPTCTGDEPALLPPAPSPANDEEEEEDVDDDDFGGDDDGITEDDEPNADDEDVMDAEDEPVNDDEVTADDEDIMDAEDEPVNDDEVTADDEDITDAEDDEPVNDDEVTADDEDITDAEDDEPVNDDEATADDATTTEEPTTDDEDTDAQTTDDEPTM
ncbi:unnamed protein product [Discosporangium mesarthrocarpum]